MAARHAGFALVSTIGEELINSLIEAAFINHVDHAGPFRFQLPSPLMIGGRAKRRVTLTGDVTLLPPSVTLRRRPDNLVAVRGRFVSELRLEGATPDPVDVDIEIGCSLFVGLSVSIVNDRFLVGIDLSQATVTAVDLRVKEGPPLVSAYGAALTSVPVLNALTDVLRSIPASLLRTTIDGFPATTHIAPRQMPCGASLFELPLMFHASFSISRVVPRVLDGNLTIGVDIAGHSSGNPNALESIFGVVRPVWVRTNGPEGPVDFRSRGVRAVGNVGVSINPDVIVSLLERTLSPASFHAFVDCHVALEGFSMTFGTFSPKLMPQYSFEGPTLHIGARYFDSPGRAPDSRLTPDGVGVHADVHMPFVVQFQTYEGPTAFLSEKRESEYWFIQVYDVEVDVPWWVTFGLALIGVAIPVFAVPVVAILDGILPALLGNVAKQVQRTAQAGIDRTMSEFNLVPRNQTTTLPGLPATPVTLTTTLLSMTGDGIETYASYQLATREDASPDRHLMVTAWGVRVHDRGVLKSDIVGARLIPCTVQLDPGTVDANDLSVRVSWEVRRRDTGDIVIQQDLPYASQASRISADFSSGPTPRRIVIDRTKPDLMPVDEFSVAVRVYRPLSGRVKEFGSCRFSVTFEDRFDRSHPYVHWKGWANGMPKKSAIHRTAVPGRCSMLMRAAHRAKFIYLDELPFPVAELNLHRDELCEYCFFGGPDKTIPLI